MITITCRCGRKLQVREELAGKEVKCPGCGQVIPVLVASAPDSPSTSTEQPRPSEEVATLEATRAGGATGDWEDYGFLAPSRAPGEMGRLGSYRVLKVLGAGGMGMVFLAEDPHLKRSVALKVMRPEIASKARNRERFLREAQATAAIKHDHIVTIYQVGEDRGVPFLAMELLEGEPLDARVKRDKRLPVADSLRIGREIADGLAAAHKRGLIHRDIKPGNIWLEASRDRVKIVDFGLARASDDEQHLTQSGAIVGTPAYMAPEQAGGKPVDARCDLFSLGCVLYRLCTGQLPFKGTDTMSTLLALATETPKPPLELSADVPSELSELVMRLLAKSPDDRPASAQDVSNAIRDIEQERTDVTGSATRSTKKSIVSGQPPASRKRRAVAGIAVLLVGLVFGGVALSRKGGSGKETIEGPKPGEPSPVPEKPPAIAVLPDKEKPFVLLRAGGAREELAYFAEVLGAQQDGDTLEVHGNGPFVLPACTLSAKQFTWKAATGYRPRFVLSKLDAGWFTIAAMRFRVQGCDFHCHGSMFGSSFPPPPAIWEVHDCRIFGNGLGSFSGASLTIANSLLVGNHGLRVEAKGARMELVNNVICVEWNYNFIEWPNCNGQTLVARNNTFWINASLLGFHHANAPKGEPITVEAEGNVFHQEGWHARALFPGEAKDRFRWLGRNNLYAHPLTLTFVTANPENKLLSQGLAGWNKWNRPEEGSREADLVRHVWEAPGLQDNAATIAEFRALTERSAAAHGLTDLGPDWSLVGPGDAYVKALVAAGKAVPQPRPAPPPDGLFVLVRGDKEVRGYLSLKDAAEAAADGDTVEIRSDRSLPGYDFGSPGKRLTIRATPGYRPTIHGPRHINGTKWKLSYEGLHFLIDQRSSPVLKYGPSGPIGPWATDNAVVRLANCSFGGFGASEYIGLPRLAADGDKPAEVVNCLMPGVVHFALPSGQRLVLRNSAIGALSLAPTLAGQRPKDIDLERSLVCAPGGAAFVQSPSDYPDRDQPAELRVTARRTLFDAPSLVNLTKPLKLSGWVGERNVYRLGGGWWDPSGSESTLVDWRKRWASDATSVEEVGASYTDPRQWKVQPGSPGSGQGPGGTDFGADVDKVARTLPAKR